MARTKKQPAEGAPLFGSYLVRRAHWLEKKLSTPEYPGRSWDAGEYADLLAVFDRIGLEFSAGTSRGPVASFEEPPRRPDDDDPPYPPKGLRYCKD